MTNEELQLHIKAINEAAEHGELQYGSDQHGWAKAANPLLTTGWYRIKPKPRELFLHRKDVPDARACNTGVSIIGTDFFGQGYDDLVRFREVLDD